MSDILKVKVNNVWTDIPAIIGPKGDTGVGVPSGGTTDQLLAKNSNTDYDFKWVNGGSGGGAVWGGITGTLSNQTDLNTALSGKANSSTTLSGYGITDANINNGVITLGSNMITPITQHQDISGKENSSNKVTSISSISTNTEYPSALAVYNALPKMINVTIPTSSWSGTTATVNVSGVTSSSNIIVSGVSSSMEVIIANRIYCSGQGNGTLTFTCYTVPGVTVIFGVEVR